MLNDRLESLDGLLEIFDVPVIVIGGTEEEAGLRRQEFICNICVDDQFIVIGATLDTLENLFAVFDEILQSIDRDLNRLAVIDTIGTVVDEELMDRIGLASVHDLLFVRLACFDVFVDDSVELVVLDVILGKVRPGINECLLAHRNLDSLGNTVQVATV